MRHYRIVPFPAGTLTLLEEDGYIIGIRTTGEPPPDAQDRQTPVLARAAAQLDAYFEGSLKTFDLPLRLSGTPFQMAVWNALKTIPYGETRSYGDIARVIGHPKAYRAVGMANHRNPVAIVIPCHRVIGSDGTLTGYGGGLPLKAWLLSQERIHAQEEGGCICLRN